MTQITLAQPAPQSLEVKPAPFERAVRWRSSYDNGKSRVWPNIFMSQYAYREVNAHAESEPDLEIGGMLIGQALLTLEKVMFVIIERALEARHVQQSATHVTFTSETLTDVHNRLDEEYPGRQILGWYHSHPALTVFLSSMDVWLHSHFFQQPWHVALVIDPYVNHGGFFYRAGGAVDYVHPKHYTGFYELIEPGDTSIVTWYNLTPDGSEQDEHKSQGNAVKTREDVSP